MSKNVDVSDNDVCTAFCGWHYSSPTIASSTVGAIAAGTLADDIKAQLIAANCFKADGTSTSTGIGNKQFIDALQTDPKAALRPLLLIPTVTVVSSNYNSLPTLCYASGYLYTTPLFTVIQTKAKIQLTLHYTTWQTEVDASNGDVNSTLAIKQSYACYLLDNSKNVDVNMLQQKPSFDVLMATLYLATLVHHLACTDGGTQFRDKLGRAAAADQLITCCQSILFLTQFVDSHKKK